VAETLGQDHDIMEVATAAISLVHRGSAGGAAGGGRAADHEPDIADLSATERPSGAGRPRPGKGAGRPARPARSARPARPGSPGRPARSGRGARGGSDVTRLYIGMGGSSGIRPADIVGAIANEAGVNPRGIGAISIADSFSIVEVPGDDAGAIIAALRSTKIRGRKVMVRQDRE
jgi:ATP-dependent RNA helicase DeaD